MILVKAICRIISLAITILLIHSCCEKEPNNTPKVETITYNDKYIIEMNKEYRISKVTHKSNEMDDGTEKIYEYSDKYVKEYSGDGILLWTYFLNSAGFADSCISGSGKVRVQYKYNQDNYLISDNSRGSFIYYEYADGNRTRSVWGTNVVYYQYNSFKNIIVIHEFRPLFLGKLNKNLIQSYQIQFPMASDRVSVTCGYTVNSEELVIKKIETHTYYNGASSTKLIAEFEFLINK